MPPHVPENSMEVDDDTPRNHYSHNISNPYRRGPPEEMPSVLLFSGLPLDVREADLAELLVAEPTRLAPHSVRVTALHDSAGTFLGTFIVEVTSDADAEKVRLQFSGQVIDGSHKLQVHHVLPAMTPHPSLTPQAGARAIIPPFGGPSATQRLRPAQRIQQGQQPAQVQQPAKRQPQQKQAAKADAGGQKPEGLKLLGRMGKPGKAGEKERQKLLLEKQRASLKTKNPGQALLSRLKIPKGSPAAKANAAKKNAAKGAAKGKGADKVARAKKGAAKMEVDSKPAPAAKKEEKAKPKTQAQLDEEMRAYERARRFAAA